MFFWDRHTGPSLPKGYSRTNQLSAICNSEWVDGAITELGKSRTFASSAEQFRQEVNMRHLNKFLSKQSFTYEDRCVAKMLLEPGELMFTFALTSGHRLMRIGNAIHKT